MSGHRNWNEIRPGQRHAKLLESDFKDFDRALKKTSRTVTVAAIFLVIVIAAVLVAVVGVVLYLLLKNFG